MWVKMKSRSTESGKSTLHCGRTIIKIIILWKSHNNALNRRPALSVARAVREEQSNEMWLSKQRYYYYVYMIQLLSLHSTHKDTTELNKRFSSHSYYKKWNSTPATAHPQWEHMRKAIRDQRNGMELWVVSLQFYSNVCMFLWLNGITAHSMRLLLLINLYRHHQHCFCFCFSFCAQSIPFASIPFCSALFYSILASTLLCNYNNMRKREFLGMCYFLNYVYLSLIPFLCKLFTSYYVLL